MDKSGFRNSVENGVKMNINKNSNFDYGDTPECIEWKDKIKNVLYKMTFDYKLGPEDQYAIFLEIEKEIENYKQAIIGDMNAAIKEVLDER